MPEKKSKVAIIKTKPTAGDAVAFLNGMGEDARRADAFALLEMMKQVTGQEPVLWSNSIIGFGNKRYKSDRTGREVDWFLIGFVPRKSNFSLHLAIDVAKRQDLLSRLGKCKTGAGCVYIDKLSDIDTVALRELMVEGFKNK